MRDVIIVGGGLAGLCSAIHLSQAGLDVLLVEKRSYPLHKVCGEYISNEVKPYLSTLDADPQSLHPRIIRRFILGSPSGKQLETRLPLGGFSISRFAFDEFLYRRALVAGVEVILNTFVSEIKYVQDSFELLLSGGQQLRSRMVIGAYGKRANLDRVLNRRFFRKRSPFIGVKYHLRMDFPSDLVALHVFPEGYCGLSQVENGCVNVCYLTTHRQLKTYGSVETLEKSLFSKHPYLNKVLQETEHVVDMPLVISEISFEPKSPVHNHILMAGDSAGLITPLCGNGMAMAIGSANMLSSLVIRYFKREIDRVTLEKIYAREWQKTYSKRIWIGRKIQALFLSPTACEAAIVMMRNMPLLTRAIIKQTHGKPFFPKGTAYEF